MKKVILLFGIFILEFVSAQDSEKIHFDEKYKKEYQGKTKIEIDETKELLHIMIAMTEVGLENDDMVEQKGKYYQDVLQHFKKFKDEKIIVKFDSIIKVNPTNYVFLTGNAISHEFKDDHLVPDKNFMFPMKEVSSHTKITVNPIVTYKKEIEDFAKKTNFRRFYKNQTPYYKTIIKEYNQQANLEQQWEWLEKAFNTKVNSYLIFCSPLINGLNYTSTYDNNYFKQIIMVLPPVSKEKNFSEKQNIVFNTRIMFTEIDHNYVSGPTKKYAKEIDNALKEREKWVNTKQEGTQYYPTPERVFDEYMTYGVFYLFCNDKFKDDQSIINYAYNDLNALMKDRGFPKMKEFNNALLTFRKKYPNKKIDDWYPEFIESCSQL
ncbi:DUF4932 domain-containing protein [Chryseobacterium sp. SSA4.19]|uniref:DUF4932 domain-containing protein n=1 Tax=Chryseobacterium sp. SSA4.19 TaxID=2919915 RepID=UPI001F4E16A3|nr:DUF4932 domain-containing protein [Chryseobacterium sp. SSA4.19]MCJ8153827.1 DUF4932 domain-containing protein [Chryseobacterium sp. SSA4.19]